MGTMPARMPSSKAVSARSCKPRSAGRSWSRRDSGQSRVAPSPPKTKGSDTSGIALRTATMEATPRAFTSL